MCLQGLCVNHAKSIFFYLHLLDGCLWKHTESRCWNIRAAIKASLMWWTKNKQRESSIWFMHLTSLLRLPVKLEWTWLTAASKAINKGDIDQGRADGQLPNFYQVFHYRPLQNYCFSPRAAAPAYIHINRAALTGDQIFTSAPAVCPRFLCLCLSLLKIENRNVGWCCKAAISSNDHEH